MVTGVMGVPAMFAPSAAHAVTILSDSFTTLDGTNSPNNMKFRHADVVDLPNTLYVTANTDPFNSAPNFQVFHYARVNTGTPDSNPALQIGFNGDASHALSSGTYTQPTNSFYTISADLSVSTLTGGSIRGIGLGFGQNVTDPTYGAYHGIPYAGTVSLDAAGEVSYAGTALGTYNPANFGGNAFSAANLYNLSFTANSTTGHITNITLKNGSGSQTFSSAATASTTAFTDSNLVKAFITTASNNVDTTGLAENFKVSASHAIISLTAAASGTPTAYGLQITSSGTNPGTFNPNTGDNKLTVTGGSGSYSVAQVTGINGAAGAPTAFVEATGFNPASDTEVFALKIIDTAGPTGLSGELNQLVNDINGSTFGLGSVVASTTPVAGIPAGYNLFLTLPGNTGSGDNFLGFDVSISNDANLTDTLSVTQVAVVPEPTSLGMVAVGALGLLARRKRKTSSIRDVYIYELYFPAK